MPRFFMQRTNFQFLYLDFFSFQAIKPWSPLRDDRQNCLPFCEDDISKYMNLFIFLFIKNKTHTLHNSSKTLRNALQQIRKPPFKNDD